MGGGGGGGGARAWGLGGLGFQVWVWDTGTLVLLSGQGFRAWSLGFGAEGCKSNLQRTCRP